MEDLWGTFVESLEVFFRYVMLTVKGGAEMIRKIILSALALSLMTAANVRTAYIVTVEGNTLEGCYTEAQLKDALFAAERAAEEICRAESSPPEYEIKRVPALRGSDGDVKALGSALIAATEGVDAVWEVTVAGERIGLCNDPSALGEVMEVLLYNGAVREAVSVSFTEEIALRRVYVEEGREYDIMELSAALNSATEVMSVTANGTVRYG